MSRNQREGHYAGRYSTLGLKKYYGHDEILWEILEKKYRRSRRGAFFWPSLKDRERRRKGTYVRTY